MIELALSQASCSFLVHKMQLLFPHYFCAQSGVAVMVAELLIAKGKENMGSPLDRGTRYPFLRFSSDRGDTLQ